MNKILLLLICILVLIYLFFVEPNRLVVAEYKIQDEALAGLKIVLVGDLHVKPHQQERLKSIIEKINEQNADLVLSVGDYVSGHKETSTLPIESIAAELSALRAQYGVYTVLGNHDWWADGEKITKALEKNGINVLANSNALVEINGKKVYIAGLEDLHTRTPKLHKALNGTKAPTILLTHSPDIFPKVPNEVNLTLAGHVHGGQVRLPFIGAIIVPSRYGNRYSQGLIEENGKKMIVTKGIGTSILPLRFNCPPEIVVIDVN